MVQISFPCSFVVVSFNLLVVNLSLLSLLLSIRAQRVSNMF